MINFENLLLILIAYSLGSLSGAIMTSHLLQLPDPRFQGSGNPGATNVLRHSGKKAALLTLLIDVFKGVIAVGIAKIMGSPPIVLAIVTFTVFIGHLYPIFFQFRGGKGVATAGGALLTLAWPVGLAAIGTWLLIALIFRYSSLAAVVTASLTPIYTFWFTGRWEYLIMSLLMSLLLLWRHRSNIYNLWHGSEDKIGQA
jgi:glycerol-3-phosphate acyltransferase PlsY